MEMQVLPALETRARLVLWPCAGGNARAYRLPRKELAWMGVEVWLYNPPGHGSSQESLTIPGAVRALATALPSDLPLHGLGHSMGGAMIPLVPVAWQSLLLVTPVLDPPLSLRTLYRNGAIGEFLSLLSTDSAIAGVLQRELADDSWLALPEWQSRNLAAVLDLPLGNNNTTGFKGNIASFLWEVFFQDFDPELSVRAAASVQSRILLPTADRWFPREFTRDLAQRYNIPVTEVSEAGDHFFRNAWGRVGELLLAQLREYYPPEPDR